MSVLSEIFSGKKKLFGENSVLTKLDPLLINQMHKATGSPDEKQLYARQLGHSLTSGITGGITGARYGGLPGAYIGATGGGVWGYQSDKPLTGKAALKDIGKGILAGTVAGKGASFLGAGKGAGASYPSMLDNTKNLSGRGSLDLYERGKALDYALQNPGKYGTSSGLSRWKDAIDTYNKYNKNYQDYGKGMQEDQQISEDALQESMARIRALIEGYNKRRGRHFYA